VAAGDEKARRSEEFFPGEVIEDDGRLARSCGAGNEERRVACQDGIPFLGEVEVEVHFIDVLCGEKALPFVIIQNFPFLGAVVGEDLLFHALLSMPLVGGRIEVELFDGFFGLGRKIQKWRVVGDSCPGLARYVVVLYERPDVDRALAIGLPQVEEQAVAFGEARLEEDFARGSRKLLDEHAAFPYPEGEKAHFFRRIGAVLWRTCVQSARGRCGLKILFTASAWEV